MTEQTHQFISVHTLTNRFEADLLMDALKQEEIPALLRSFEETPYDGLFVSQRGWGLIMVPQELADRARLIIQPLLKNIEAGGLYVEPSEIDPLLWEKLRKMEPETVCRRARVQHDPETGAYLVPFLNVETRCFPEEERIEDAALNSFLRLDFQFYLAMLHYLLEARDVDRSGEWISEKDIPGGELFFRGPHRFPLEPLLDLFGTRPELFEAASKRLGGTREEMGDVAYRLEVFPRVPMLFVLWRGDDEFAPAMHIRFARDICLHIRTLDTIWALVNVVCRTLRAAGKVVSAETLS